MRNLERQYFGFITSDSRENNSIPKNINEIPNKIIYAI
jgi:hypothetical protein